MSYSAEIEALVSHKHKLEAEIEQLQEALASEELQRAMVIEKCARVAERDKVVPSTSKRIADAIRALKDKL